MPSARVRGVRAVAVFEAMKGILVLAVGFGLLALVHRDLQSMAENLVQHLHLNPSWHYPRVFIESAAHFDNSNIRSLAALAGLYVVVRFIEAYGLWHMKAWAEWFAIISGSIYVPVEAFKIIERITWTRVTLLLINLLIVGYLIYIRRKNRIDHVKASIGIEGR